MKNQAAPCGFAVDERRIVDDPLIALDDFAIKRTIDVRCRLDGLDARGRVRLGELAPASGSSTKTDPELARACSVMLGRDVALRIFSIRVPREFQHTQVLLITFVGLFDEGQAVTAMGRYLAAPSANSLVPISACSAAT